ncbi:ABC transporter substrate-binding protein [Paenibacillus pinistramenti]|uniref:ABC transporter substrate-binding protein n=1 Tax=Paenibacillus pinistramenti TaxID=1768003 RepID=UPI001EF14E65|nr:ABC transporter substrate-binding protein [Paenibacillus pinistramenti]
MSISLSGCSAGGGPDQELTEVNVLLDWYPNAVHTFLFAAQQEGYFEQEGLKVNLETPADTNDAIKLVAAGKADLAVSYQTQVAQSRAEKIPVVSVAALVRHPLNQLFVRKDSGITSPKDLAGKRVGYPSTPLSEAIISTMVESDGGDPSKLNFTDIGWDLIPAMTTGRVDAIIGGYINHEKLLIEKEGVQLLTFNPSRYGVPDNYELVLTASEDGLSKHEETIRRFLKAAAKGQAYTVQHPDEALQMLLKHESRDFPLDPDVEKQSLQILLPLMDDGTEGFGAQTEESWNAVIQWLKQQGQIKAGSTIKAQDAFRNLGE